MSLALVGLGSNVGDRAANLNRAVELLRQTPGIEVAKVSRWHETRPIGGPPGQDAFLNGAVLLRASLGPEQVHQALIQIENQLGRKREVRWQARTLDLDLLLFDGLQINTPALTIPHPRFAFRRFAIEPAAEVAAGMMHPTVQWTLQRLRDHLRDARPYVAITGPAGTGKTRLALELAAHSGGQMVLSPQLPPRGAESQSGRALAWELELLAERAALLSPRAWPTEAPLVVSDFWLGQSRHYLPTGHAEFASRFWMAMSSVVRPKLVAVTSRPARLDETAAAAAEGDQAATFLGLCAGQNEGLVLRLPADDPEAAWIELTAAVAAMS